MSRVVEKLALREAASAARDFIMSTDNSSGCCMCGNAVDSHGIGDGHAPVDDGDYHAMQIVEAIDAALTTPPARSYADGAEDAARIVSQKAQAISTKLGRGKALDEVTLGIIAILTDAAADIRVLSQGGKA